MIYGLDSYILPGPYSLIISILLLLGVFFIGERCPKFFFKKLNLKDYKKEYIFFSPITGTYLVIFPLYILTVFELGDKNLYLSVSFVLLILGIINLLILLSKNFFFEKKTKIKIFDPILIVILIYTGLFLVAASPITQADSLDYHIHGAINILNLGKFHDEILPMHNNLVSLGEIILTLGLSIKAEQFATLLQYSSILSLIPIFKKIDKQKYTSILFIISCPIVFFLVSSPKPQILFVIASLIIFVFLVSGFKKLNNEKIKIIFPIIIFVLFINFIVKYSFLLSSSLLGFYIFYLMAKKRLILFSITSSFLLFVITLLPLLYFRFKTFGTGFPEIFLSPLPINIYGYDKFHYLLSGGSLSFLELFFAKNLNTFSTTYGPSLLFLLFLINKKMYIFKLPTFLILTFFILGFNFGGNQSRFLLEGVLWLTYITAITINFRTIKYKIFQKVVLLQSFMMLLVALYFVFNIFPGSISSKQRELVMNKYANGYSLANWVNKNLNNDAILISTHRSISLYKNKTYSSIFTWLLDFKEEKTLIYAEILKKNKINTIIIHEGEYGENLTRHPFKGCLGNELNYKKNAGRKTGRNPFTKAKYYDVWIYEFKYKNLPDCLVK